MAAVFTGSSLLQVLGHEQKSSELGVTVDSLD